jgi:hypothetical protein
LRTREKHGGFKAINKRCSKDLQAVVDGYCKFWDYTQYCQDETFVSLPLSLTLILQ